MPREILLPDACNTGIVFRVLLAVNAAALGACLLTAATSATVADGLSRFLGSAMLLEGATLASLVLLCLARRPAGRLPGWQQRLLCGLLPALVAGAAACLLQGGFGVFDALTPVSPLPAAFAALAAGLLLQHYFELRARAASPVLAEARLQALQARIRPHFLFNSLNAVLSLVRSDPRRAEATLEDLADLFRVFMRETRALLPLADELRLCRQYLAIEQVRLGERLLLDWDDSGIDAATLQRAQVPSLLLQPLLENAVHHGVEPSTGPATVSLRLARHLDRIEVSISNPIGLPSAPGNHMALDNVRERLALLHDVEAELAIERSDDRFTVRLRFPYVKGTT